MKLDLTIAQLERVPRLLPDGRVVVWASSGPNDRFPWVTTMHTLGGDQEWLTVGDVADAELLIPLSMIVPGPTAAADDVVSTTEQTRRVTTTVTFITPVAISQDTAAAFWGHADCFVRIAPRRYQLTVPVKIVDDGLSPWSAVVDVVERLVGAVLETEGISRYEIVALAMTFPSNETAMAS